MMQRAKHGILVGGCVQGVSRQSTVKSDCVLSALRGCVCECVKQDKNVFSQNIYWCATTCQSGTKGSLPCSCSFLFALQVLNLYYCQLLLWIDVLLLRQNCHFFPHPGGSGTHSGVVEEKQEEVQGGVLCISDPHNLKICCRVNGEVVQSSNTNQMVFKTEELIAWVSQ